MSEPTAVLRLNRVSKEYRSAESGENLVVLHDVSLEIAAGESVAIIGPSGSGKSTLLNIVGTLDRPSSGEILLDGENLSHLAEDRLAAVRNQRIGFIFQSHHLLPQCTVLENVLIPLLAAKNRNSRNGAETRAYRLLERVGLGKRTSHRPGQLSGGERQRVAVVRALINEPKLLLADEPTGALDRTSAEQMGDLLVELNREDGVTLIVVTHALDLAKRMRRILKLEGGRLKKE